MTEIVPFSSDSCARTGQEFFSATILAKTWWEDHTTCILFVFAGGILKEKKPQLRIRNTLQSTIPQDELWGKSPNGCAWVTRPYSILKVGKGSGQTRISFVLPSQQISKLCGQIIECCGIPFLCEQKKKKQQK